MFQNDPLARRALVAAAQFQLALGLLILLPAWNLAYWQGWLTWAVLGLSILAMTLWLIRSDRALLEARLAGGPGAEARPFQRRIQTLTAVCLMLELALPGVCHAFGIGRLGPVWVVAANVVVAAAMAGIALVFKANSTTHSSVRISAGQRVITTGPYSVVRHPMYAMSLLLFLALPVALGAWPPVVIAAVMGCLMSLRAKDEEKMLLARLPGYAAYVRLRRWRMIPGLW